MRSPLVRSVCLLAALALLGCGTRLPGVGSLRLPGSGPVPLSEEELHDEVSSGAARFVNGVSGAADSITAQTTDRSVRRSALVWKINAVPLAHRAALLDRPTEGLLALLELAASQRQYLVEGAGQEVFGDQQGLARQAAISLEEDLRALVHRILDREKAAQLIAHVDQVAEQHPVRGEFTFEATLRGLVQLAGTGRLDWFLRAPMAPFRALEGVESGAEEIHAFNQTARQFAQVISSMPERTRWEAELLLYDIEERDTVVAGLTAFESLAQSAERFSLAADGLPQAMGRELDALLERSGETQQELRTTLDALHRVIEAAHPVAESLERTSSSVNAASQSWAEVIAALRRPAAEKSAEAQDAPKSRPFDPTDYERAAAQIQSATHEIRGLLADLRELRITPASLLDTLLWRALAFVAGCVALLLAYRILVAHFVTRGPRGRGHSVRARPI